MSAAAIVYVAGLPLAVVAVAVYFEAERRASCDPRTREATLEPGLAGVTFGLVWPLVAAAALALGLLALIVLAARGLLAVLNRT